MTLKNHETGESVDDKETFSRTIYFSIIMPSVSGIFGCIAKMSNSDFWDELRRRLRHNWRLFFCILVPIILSPLAWTMDDFVHNGNDEEDPNKKFRAMYVIAIMAMFWVFEVIPLGVTSLFPLVLFPLLDIQNAASVSQNYMRESNMIFLGAIILSLAIEYCGLHIRCALRVISVFGTNPSRIMLGTMIITALLSMWLSDTSCTSMILPILSAITAAMFQEEQAEEIEEVENTDMQDDAPAPAPTYTRVRRQSVVFANSAMERNLNSIPAISARRKSRCISAFPLQQTSELSFVKKDILSQSNSHSSSDGGRESLKQNSSMSIIMENGGFEEEDEDEENEDQPKSTEQPPLPPCGLPEAQLEALKRAAAEGSNMTNDAEMQENIRKMLLFAVAYSASIGGSGSLIGTGPIKVFKELAKRFELEKNENYIGITFATWMGFNLPPLIVNIVIVWLFLILRYIGFKSFRKGYKTTTVEKKKVKEYLETEYKKLGPITAHEIGVLLIFILVVLLWFFRDPQLFHGWDSLIGVHTGDSTPAMLGAILLFVIPRNWSFLKRGKYYPPAKYEALLDWKFVSTNAPWGYVLLIGSGYAIADGSEVSGLSHFIAEKLASLGSLSKPILLMIVMVITSIITEVVSNTACASLILPIIFTVSCRISIHPLYLTMASAVSASYAFMLPISSPPNAIIFATGELETKEMVVNGVSLNIMCSIVLYIFIVTYGEVLFHFSTFTSVPCP